MLRKILCAVAILAISLGVAMAEEIKGKITKIEGNKITVATKADAAGKVLECVADCKVCKLEGTDKVKIDGGLGSVKIGEKGKGATVITNNDGKVTEIIFQGKKK